MVSCDVGHQSPPHLLQYSLRNDCYLYFSFLHVFIISHILAFGLALSYCIYFCFPYYRIYLRLDVISRAALAMRLYLVGNEVFCSTIEELLCPVTDRHKLVVVQRGHNE